MSDVDLNDILGEDETPKKRGRGRPRKEEPVAHKEPEEVLPPVPLSTSVASLPATPEFPLAPSQDGLRPGDAGYNYSSAQKDVYAEVAVLTEKISELNSTALELSAMGHKLQPVLTFSQVNQMAMASNKAASKKAAEEAENAKEVLAKLGLGHLKLTT
jgi:hypothetical protein